MALLSESLGYARGWGETVLALAFPWPESAEAAPVPVISPWCAKCGEPYPALSQGGYPGEFFCHNCIERPVHFAWARAAYRTEGQVLESIVGFKYQNQYFRLKQLTGWLAEVYDRHVVRGDWDALVPVPLHRLRHRSRGFNQALELARSLSKMRRISMLDALYRYRETNSQAGLERNARWTNMAEAFRVKPGFDVRGQRLLLIDDVFTTGATVDACARALKQAGSGTLAVLTIARS